MQEQADELVASLIGLRSEDWVGTVKDSLGTPEQPIGQTRNHTGSFHQMRRLLEWRKRRVSQSAMRRDRMMSLDLATECQRLTEGFGKNISSSSWRTSLEHVKGVLATGKPDWVRTNRYLYEKLYTTCGHCRNEFTLTQSKHYCCICGVAVCATCSSRDMILYVPDGQPTKQENVTWAIIKIVGCPEKEPSVCYYLRVCTDCHHRLRQYQVDMFQTASVADTKTEEFWPELTALEQKIGGIGRKIKTQLPRYRDFASMLGEHDNSRRMSEPSPTSGRSHIQTLAKLQCDLSDHFSQSVMLVFELKRLKTSTPGQASLLKNILKANADMYFDATFAYRFYRKSLESVLSLDGLTKIQKVVDENAMNNTYLIVRQLGLESLVHCSKHKLSMDLPTLLAQLEEVSQSDVKTYVTDWDEHVTAVTTFVQMNIKEKPFLPLSSSRLQYYTPLQIEVKVWWMCFMRLQNTQLKLVSKTADNRFKGTKICFEETLGAIQERIRTMS